MLVKHPKLKMGMDGFMDGSFLKIYTVQPSVKYVQMAQACQQS